MLKVIIHNKAIEEINSASRYYEEQVEGLGNQFLDDINDGLTWIRKFPYTWPVYEGEYKRYLLKRFPYGLVYRIDIDSILIIAVTHLHRKPGYWKYRH